MRKSITKRAVDALKLGEYIADDEVMGFVVRRLPSGRLSYGYRYTNAGKRRWVAIGVGITPHAARESAKIHAGNVAKSEDPVTDRETRRKRAIEARTLNKVLDAFLKERVHGKKLRSATDVQSMLDRFVRPKLGDRPINEIKRSEIAMLLDDVADRPSIYSKDGKSSRLADKVLGVLRPAFNWHATRDDEFRSPIVSGMTRTTVKELTRSRTLSDEEVRALWKVLDNSSPAAFVRIVRMLLVTGARRDEISTLAWSEIDGDMLVIPASRVKTKIHHVLPVTNGIRVLIGPRAEDAGPFVFSTDGGLTSFSGFSKSKARLDVLLAEYCKENGFPELPPWRLHDLRRTARSLMSRAGVSSDIGERVLGHALPGIRGVYDRYAYLDEKRNALERLGALVKSIVELPEPNVVRLPRRAGAK